MKRINIGFALVAAQSIASQKIGNQKQAIVCDVKTNGTIGKRMIEMNKFNKRPDEDFIFVISLIAWIVIMFLVLFTFRENCFAVNNSNKHTDVIYHHSIAATLDRLNAELVVATEREIEDIEPTPTSTPEPQSFYPLTDYERWLVESIVAGESGIEPYWGKVAVASCILNACLLEDKRPEEIQTMYGYAGWEPIEKFESECMTAYGNTKLANEVRDAVNQVFDEGEVLNNEILWFCSSYSEWHESQKFIIEIGNHRFFGSWN